MSRRVDPGPGRQRDRVYTEWGRSCFFFHFLFCFKSAVRPVHNAELRWEGGDVRGVESLASGGAGYLRGHLGPRPRRQGGRRAGSWQALADGCLAPQASCCGSGRQQPPGDVSLVCIQPLGFLEQPRGGQAKALGGRQPRPRPSPRP